MINMFMSIKNIITPILLFSSIFLLVKCKYYSGSFSDGIYYGGDIETNKGVSPIQIIKNLAPKISNHKSASRSGAGRGKGFAAGQSETGSSSRSGDRGWVQASIQSRHRNDYIDMPNLSVDKIVKPLTVEVASVSLPLNLVFRSRSSTLNLLHQHEPAVGEVRESSSEDGPHFLYHTVKKPIYQEVYELINPERRIIQEIMPVQEEIKTIINRDPAGEYSLSSETGSNVGPMAPIEGRGGTKPLSGSPLYDSPIDPKDDSMVNQQIIQKIPESAKMDNSGYFSNENTKSIGVTMLSSMTWPTKDYDSPDRSEGNAQKNYPTLLSPSKAASWVASNEKMQKASSVPNIHSTANYRPYTDKPSRFNVYKHPLLFLPSQPTRKQINTIRPPQSLGESAKFKKFYREYLKMQGKNSMNETGQMIKSEKKAVNQINFFDESEYHYNTLMRPVLSLIEQQKQEKDCQKLSKMMQFEDSISDGAESTNEQLSVSILLNNKNQSRPSASIKQSSNTSGMLKHSDQVKVADQISEIMKPIASGSESVPSTTTTTGSITLNAEFTTPIIPTTTTVTSQSNDGITSTGMTTYSSPVFNTTQNSDDLDEDYEDEM